MDIQQMQQYQQYQQTEQESQQPQQSNKGKYIVIGLIIVLVIVVIVSIYLYTQRKQIVYDLSGYYEQDGKRQDMSFVVTEQYNSNQYTSIAYGNDIGAFVIEINRDSRLSEPGTITFKKTYPSNNLPITYTGVIESDGLFKGKWVYDKLSGNVQLQIRAQ